MLNLSINNKTLSQLATQSLLPQFVISSYSSLNRLEYPIQSMTPVIIVAGWLASK